MCDQQHQSYLSEGLLPQIDTPSFYWHDDVHLMRQPANPERFEEGSYENPPILQTKKTSLKTTKKKCLKTIKNRIKNLYPNCMKSTLNKILKDDDPGSVFNKKLAKLCKQVSSESVNLEVGQFKGYCRQLPNEFRLMTINHYIDYQNGPLSERIMKKVLNKFFIWFLRKKYTIQVLKSDQCDFKDQYLRGKVQMSFLPTSKKETKPRKNTVSSNV